jgi:hypothetical protein
MLVNRHRILLTVSLVAALGALAGCGSSSNGASTSTDKKTSAAASPSGAPTGGPPTGQLAAIQTCLKAAGITVNIPTGRPTFSPGATTRPTGSPPAVAGQGGGFGAIFTDPKAQAALKACGITLPTGRPSGP